MAKINPELFQVKIHTTNKCSLQCEHCLNSTRDIQKTFTSVPDIKRQIDFIIEMGITGIEMGSLIGDTLEYPINYFREIVSYMESLSDRITSISISTACVFLTKEHIEIFNSCTIPIRLQLSWYGKDEEEYQKISGINAYSKFLDNLDLFWDCTSQIELTLISMFPTKVLVHPAISKILKLKEKDNISINLDMDAGVTDWETMVTNKETVHDSLQNRKGACAYLFADLGFISGNKISACAWFDYNEELLLGDIDSDPKEIIKNHKKIVFLQNKGIFTGPCKNCLVYKKKTDNSKVA